MGVMKQDMTSRAWNAMNETRTSDKDSVKAQVNQNLLSDNYTCCYIDQSLTRVQYILSIKQ